MFSDGNPIAVGFYDEKDFVSSTMTNCQNFKYGFLRSLEANAAYGRIKSFINPRNGNKCENDYILWSYCRMWLKTVINIPAGRTIIVVFLLFYYLLVFIPSLVLTAKIAFRLMVSNNT